MKITRLPHYGTLLTEIGIVVCAMAFAASVAGWVPAVHSLLLSGVILSAIGIGWEVWMNCLGGIGIAVVMVLVAVVFVRHVMRLGKSAPAPASADKGDTR